MKKPPRPWVRGDKLLLRLPNCPDQQVTFKDFHTAQGAPGRYYTAALVILPDGRESTARITTLRLGCRFRDCPREPMKGMTTCPGHHSAGGTREHYLQMATDRERRREREEI